MWNPKKYIVAGNYDNLHEANEKNKQLPGSILVTKSIDNKKQFIILTKSHFSKMKGKNIMPVRKRKTTHRRRRVSGVSARASVGARRRRRHHRVGAGIGGLNMSLIMDAILAYVIVALTPSYVIKLFKLTGLSATTVDLIGGGVGYLAGKIFKKPALSDLSVGIALASVVASFIPSILSGTTSTAPATQKSLTVPQGNADFYRIGAYGNYLPVVQNYSMAFGY